MKVEGSYKQKKDKIIERIEELLKVEQELFDLKRDPKQLNQIGSSLFTDNATSPMIKLSLQDTATSPMERKKNSSDQKLTHSEQLCQKYEEFLVYLCQMLDLNSIMEL